jgi:hypothetical protein
MTEDEFEPARRELCPDVTCIGLVGPDGRCRVCGAVGASAVADPRHRGMKNPAAPEENGAADELDDDRELCPDGSCIGIIGPDGRCKECGARATSRVGEGGEARPAVRANGAEPLSTEAEASADDEDRELCSNDICIGLIGPDGRCKVCGTARSSSAS